MNHEEFSEMINKANLFLPDYDQINVERFKAEMIKGEYHIVLELCMGGERLIIKDIYRPSSEYGATLYGLQKVFFTSIFDKIIQLGLTNLIKQEV